MAGKILPYGARLYHEGIKKRNKKEQNIQDKFGKGKVKKKDIIRGESLSKWIENRNEYGLGHRDEELGDGGRKILDCMFISLHINYR